MIMLDGNYLPHELLLTTRRIAKRILAPLGITTAASAMDAGI